MTNLSIVLCFNTSRAVASSPPPPMKTLFGVPLVASPLLLLLRMPLQNNGGWTKLS